MNCYSYILHTSYRTGCSQWTRTCFLFFYRTALKVQSKDWRWPTYVRMREHVGRVSHPDLSLPAATGLVMLTLRVWRHFTRNVLESGFVTHHHKHILNAYIVNQFRIFALPKCIPLFTFFLMSLVEHLSLFHFISCFILSCVD